MLADLQGLLAPDESLNGKTILSNTLSLDITRPVIQLVLKSKQQKKRRCKISSNKKWFDKECCYKRHELRKLSNQKHRDPLNSTLREEIGRAHV